MHDIILILIPSRWFNSLSGACSSYHILGSKLFILFSGAPSYFNYHSKPPSNSSQALNLILFIFHFSCFHYRSSHGGSSCFNSSSKFHQDSCWSSSILHHAFQLQSFPPYLFRWCYVILDKSFMNYDSRVIKNEIFKPIIFFVQEIFPTLQFIRWSNLGLYFT